MKKINFDKVKKEKKKKDKEVFKKKKERVKAEKPKRKRFRFRFFYWLCVLMVIGALCVFIGGIGFCYYIVKSAPEYNIDKMFEKEPSRVFDSEGRLIATLGSEQREKITYDQLPQVLIDAIIATEDSRFFQHNGFDAPRFIKASVSQVLGHGGGGASTLTMQLSKLAFTDTNTEGFAGIVRKFTDIYMAVFKMERNLTKEEIIEYYVNNPCLGGNIYGVQQASKYYFNKDVSNLNLVEAAQIAGMFQSPNGYNPYLNPNDANERKNTVLYLMKRHGYISDEEYEAGTSVEIKDFLDKGSSSANEYQGFIDTVVWAVEADTGNNPYDVPMDIYTTMVKSKQDAINEFYKTWKFRDPKVEVGIGVVENSTGKILAVGAGRYKTDAMTMNLATFDGQIKRMPGSTAKPILDYGPALEYTNVGDYGPFIDDKVSYGGGYMRNFNGAFNGFMSLRTCLKNSVNTCALQAFRLTTNEQKRDFAAKLGVEFEEDVIPDSYSIGAFNGVSPVQLASAYSAFGNDGVRMTPHCYTKIIYRETDEEIKPVVKAVRAMKPQTAYIIADILRTATNSKVKVSGTQVATKTGTTSYDSSVLRSHKLSDSIIPDAWTSSFTADYAMAIWYGYVDDLSEENIKNKYYFTMSHTNVERANILAWLAPRIYEKNTKFKNPGGISTFKVELETIPAQSPSKYTPSNLVGSFMYIGNTGPSETSSRFEKLTDPRNVTYNVSKTQVKLSWTSPGTPSAIDTDYLRNYFEKSWKIQPDKYLNKRLDYNNSNIGSFGFRIYLIKGNDSVYVDFTNNTEYTIDLTKYNETYDGIVIRSSYSKFTDNMSDGYRISETINKPEAIDDTKLVVTIDGLTKTMAVGETFTELTTENITSITYKAVEIKPEVTALSMVTSSITKEGSEGTLTPDKVGLEAGTYKVNYTVSFTYNRNPITKTYTQVITVQ